MSSRRNANGVSGPQSALTDYLAANNISAAQIRQDFERRRQEAEAQALINGEGSSAAAAATANLDEMEDEAVAAAEQAVENKRKRKKTEEKAMEMIKNAKKKKKQKKSHKKKSGGSDDDDDVDDDYDDALDLYTKARPAPGQFGNCELCEKRFTVTPYSKEGPDGGLLCTACGKQMVKDVKTEDKAKQKKVVGKKRRQVESNRLDGLSINGVKSLQQLCIEKIVQNYDSIEELGDIAPTLLNQLSMIFSKRRVMNSKTLKPFMRPNLQSMAIHDAAYLEVDDYIEMFSVNPNIQRLIIRNACQLKDQVIEYMIDKCDNITYLQLYAANLISDPMWSKLFCKYGKHLDTLKLNWLDASFDDNVVSEMVLLCPNLSRLKLKLCRQIGEGALDAISTLKHLQHLSLQVSRDISTNSIHALVESVGSKLQTLSLECFANLDDSIIEVIHNKCTRLSKLRITHNDTITDKALTLLFTEWQNPGLTFIDLSSLRDVDQNNSKGPDEANGLSDSSFTAIMSHSGQTLQTLNMASCRHVSLTAFNETFNGNNLYPELENINLSFCSKVDTSTIAGIFKSCPNVKKVIAFGCFDVTDVVVPRGVVLIGVPKAQDEIEQIGAADLTMTTADKMEMMGKFIDVGA